MHYSLVKNRVSSSLRKVDFEVCGFPLVRNFEHVVSADNHKIAAYGNWWKLQEAKKMVCTPKSSEAVHRQSSVVPSCWMKEHKPAKLASAGMKTFTLRDFPFTAQFAIDNSPPSLKDMFRLLQVWWAHLCMRVLYVFIVQN